MFSKHCFIGVTIFSLLRVTLKYAAGFILSACLTSPGVSVWVGGIEMNLTLKTGYANAMSASNSFRLKTKAFVL